MGLAPAHHKMKIQLNLKQYIKGKVAVFIDAANILYSQQDLKWEIDYKKLAKYFQNNYNLKFLGFYYGMIRENEGQAKFFAMLKDRGFTVKTKPVKYIKTPKGTILKGNLNIELAYDVLRLEKEFDTCLLFSGDSDFEIILKHLKKRKKQILVISTKGHVSIELIRNCNKYIDLKRLRGILERKRQ